MQELYEPARRRQVGEGLREVWCCGRRRAALDADSQEHITSRSTVVSDLQKRWSAQR